MPVVGPTVLGLSHIFGEAGPLADQLAYWTGCGLETEFVWDLPVASEKRRRLLARPAASVRLHYLRWGELDGAPGLELLRHEGAPVSDAADPLLTIFLRAPSIRERRDPHGNRVVEHPALATAVTVTARVPDPCRAGAILAALGFLEVSIETSESRLLGSPAGAWSTHQALFPKRSFRIVLLADTSAPERPTVDRPGFTGLSLWTPSLAEAGARVALTAHQRIDGKDAVKEVAFFCGEGLLLELLQAARKPGK